MTPRRRSSRLGSLLAWHRSSALVLGASLLLYTLTGWLFALPDLGDRRWRDTEHRLALDDPAAFRRDPAAAMPALIDGLGERARVDQVESTPDGVRVLARRPGLRIELELAPADTAARVRVRHGGPWRTGTGLHGTIHYEGGPAFVLWAAVADASALSLLLFAVTGVVLAWRRSPAVTLAVLLPATAFSLAVIGVLGSAY